MNPNEPGQPEPARFADSVTRDLDVPSVALAIGAHPDDVEFGGGATLAKWAARGCQVHLLICTDGSKGTWNPDADLAVLIAEREDEQRAAAVRLAGARSGEVLFLREIDGELTNGREVQGRVAAVIRRLRPDVILTHDPWKRYRLHPDHRATGEIVGSSIVAARDPHFFPEDELAPHRPRCLLLWEADEPNHVEDVTGFVDTKLQALEAYASQFESTMGADDAAGLDGFRRAVRERLAGLGTPFGYAAAEVFTAIRDL